MQSEEVALNSLKNKNIEFTVAEFRRTISRHSSNEAFHLFIQAGILRKIADKTSILKYSIQKGSTEKVRTMLSELQMKILSAELFFELIDRAAFEQYDTPNSSTATKWRTLLYDFFDCETDVNFVKVQTFKFPNRQTEEQSSLRLAVFMKDPQLVQSLIDRHALVNFQFHQDSFLRGGNLLHLIAAQKKSTHADLVITQILIKARIQIDLKDNHYYTPLALCAINGLNDIAQMLIRHDAQIDQKVGFNEDKTILMYSIAHENFYLAKLLIDLGVNIHHRDKNGWTAARLAFSRGVKEIGEALITKGAILRPFIGLGGSPCKGGGITVETLDNTASGSAYAAGIRRNDILIEADFQPINTIPELINVICQKRPLDTVEIIVLREFKFMKFIVEIQVI